MSDTPEETTPDRDDAALPPLDPLPVAPPMTAVDAERLVTKLDEATDEMGLLNSRLDQIKKKAEAADKVARSVRKLVAVLMVLLVCVLAVAIAIGIAVNAYRDTVRSNERAIAEVGRLTSQLDRTIRDIEANRAEARFSSCVGFNVEQQGDRDSSLNNALVTFGLAEAGDLTAADRERIVANQSAEAQARYRQLEAQAAIDNPFRDCSAQGIDESVANPPSDPALSS